MKIKTQNDLKATYAMDMILTHAGKPKPVPADDISAIPTIKPLKRLTKAESMILADVATESVWGQKKYAASRSFLHIQKFIS